MAKWMKKKQAAESVGISERTFRKWMNSGLRYSQLPTGMIFVRESAIDEYLTFFETDSPTEDQQAEQAVADMLREFGETEEKQ